MKSNLLHYLICPRCNTKFSLRYKKKIKNEILEGVLVCSNRHSFKIKNGIPRLVFDKSKGFVKTEKAFSDSQQTLDFVESSELVQKMRKVFNLRKSLV